MFAERPQRKHWGSFQPGDNAATAAFRNARIHRHEDLRDFAIRQRPETHPNRDRKPPTDRPASRYRRFRHAAPLTPTLDPAPPPIAPPSARATPRAERSRRPRAAAQRSLVRTARNGRSWPRSRGWRPRAAAQLSPVGPTGTRQAAPRTPFPGPAPPRAAPAPGPLAASLPLRAGARGSSAPDAWPGPWPVARASLPAPTPRAARAGLPRKRRSAGVISWLSRPGQGHRSGNASPGRAWNPECHRSGAPRRRWASSAARPCYPGHRPRSRHPACFP